MPLRRGWRRAACVGAASARDLVEGSADELRPPQRGHHLAVRLGDPPLRDGQPDPRDGLPSRSERDPIVVHPTLPAKPQAFRDVQRHRVSRPRQLRRQRPVAPATAQHSSDLLARNRKPDRLLHHTKLTPLHMLLSAHRTPGAKPLPRRAEGESTPTLFRIEKVAQRARVYAPEHAAILHHPGERQPLPKTSHDPHAAHQTKREAVPPREAKPTVT